MNGEADESYLIPIKSDEPNDTSSVHSSYSSASSYISEVSAWFPIEDDALTLKPPIEIILNEENEINAPLYLRILGFVDNPLATSPVSILIIYSFAFFQ